MSRGEVTSKAPRPSRRRGGRIRLKAEEADLRQGPMSSIWLSLVESIVGSRAMEDGLLAAKDGAVRSLLVECGAIRGPVQADAEAARAVSIVVPVIDETGWSRLIDAMSREARWAAKLLEGEVPDEFGALFQGCGTPLLPTADSIQTEVESGGRRDGWRVAALSWIAAERLWRDPLALLMLRGMTSDTLVERIGHRRAWRADGEMTAHPPVDLPSEIASGPPLNECLETWWRPRGQWHQAETEPYAHHALLRRLGPSTLGGQFPLSGLLATIYDEAAAEAARLIDAPLADSEDASS